MPKTATTFENHENFGAYTRKDKDGNAIEWPSAAGLKVEQTAVKTADKDAQRSGEISIPVYSLEENAENPLGSVLTLFGGSQVELAKAALNAYNSQNRTNAAASVRTKLEGPEAILNKVITRIAKLTGKDEADLKAKAKADPASFAALVALIGD